MSKNLQLLRKWLFNIAFLLLCAGIVSILGGFLTSNVEMRGRGFPYLLVGLAFQMIWSFSGSNYRRHFAYLKYVLRHKWFVLRAGLQLGVPLLILIFHDWDKFLPDEWFPYTRNFYNPDGSKKGKEQYVESEDFRLAWLLHQNRNKHHYQFWIRIDDSGVVEAMEMPFIHRLEMLADWIGAGRAIVGKDSKVWEWYEATKHNKQIHPNTRSWIEFQIEMLRTNYEVSLAVSVLDQRPDAEAIAGDWKAVGNYIRNATEKFKNDWL